MHFNSSASVSLKRDLVRTFYDRVRQIFTEDNLGRELQLLHDTLVENGYPPRFIEECPKSGIARARLAAVSQKSVYLLLSFEGESSSVLVKCLLGATVKRTYNATRLIFVEKTISVSTTWGVL